MIKWHKIEGFEKVRCVSVKNRLSQITLLYFALLLSYAQNPSCAKNPLSGSSISFNLAYDCLYVKHGLYHCDYTVFPDPWTGLWKKVNTNELFKQKCCNINPAISFGYSFFKNNWYFGAVGELSFGKSHKKLATIGPYFNAIFSTSGFSGGIRAMGGYYFNDINTLIYGIAGMKWRNIETQVNYDDGVVSFFGSKEKLACPLFVIGTGVERLICEKLSVFAEYEYTWRNSKGTAETKRFGIYKFKMKEHFREHSFRLGVKYHI
ncbi:MAG: outer membrane beta-barrel protein [Alphaproteobacteria bacterium]|nr:outer membrane beta-barrel protein [Alphaproteobacteria bacterium]